MAVDEELTQRIRAVVSLDPRVSEKRMFGGICFLLDGKILVAARRSGGLLVQCGAEAARELTQEAGVAYMVMRGKQTPNFVDVEGDLVETDEGLARWIAVAERFVASKPSGRK